MQQAMSDMQSEAYMRFMANESRRARILIDNAPEAIRLATHALEAIHALIELEQSMQTDDGLAPTFGGEALQEVAGVLHEVLALAGRY